jgi:hypothetical protein
MTNCRETPFKFFRFTLLSKNAPAKHLESHSCKNKGLKVPCFHTLTKNIGGRGVCLRPNMNHGPRITGHESPVTNHESRGGGGYRATNHQSPPLSPFAVLERI